MKKKHEARTRYDYFKFLLVLCFMIEQNEKRKRKREKQKEGRTNRHRDGLPAEGWSWAGSHFPPDTTSGGGSSRVSLKGLPKREREVYLNLRRRQKRQEIRKNKTHIQ